jgi:hypothetical protein
VDTVEIIIIAVIALIAVLALLGFIAQRRRLESMEAQFRAMVERANNDLAAAHAADNGWDPGRLEAAARQAFSARVPGAAIDEIELVQVVDKPGIEEDEAVFHARTGSRTEPITLRRRGDDWVPA